MEEDITTALAQAELMRDRLNEAFGVILENGHWPVLPVMIGIQSFAALALTFSLHRVGGTAADLEEHLESFAALCRSIYLQGPPQADDMRRV